MGIGMKAKERAHHMAQVKDPVCGMTLESEQAAATVTHKGQTYHFCSPMCKTKFAMNPDKYAATAGEAQHHGHHPGH